MSKKGFKKRVLANRVEHDLFTENKQLSSKPIRVITIYEKKPVDFPFEADGKFFVKHEGRGYKRVLRVGPLCKESDYDLAKSYGGYIISSRALLITEENYKEKYFNYWGKTPEEREGQFWNTATVEATV